jgi:hypothetical protein
MINSSSTHIFFTPGYFNRIQKARKTFQTAIHPGTRTPRLSSARQGRAYYPENL